MEVIVAAGLALVVASGLIATLKETGRFGAKVASSTDLQGLRLQINQTPDCNLTMAGRTMGNPCLSDAYIDLRNSSNGVFVKEDGSTAIGDWNIRALCRIGGLQIRAAKLTPVGRSQPSSSSLWNFDSSVALDQQAQFYGAIIEMNNNF